MRGDNFTYNVRESNKSWLVAFVDPNSNIKSELDQAAVKLNGKVEMGKVLEKVDSENVTKLYNVTTFPTILYFPSGDKSDKKNYEKYNGGITANEIVTWALKKHKEEPTGKYICLLLGSPLMLLACHKKSYLICDEITNF